MVDVADLQRRYENAIRLLVFLTEDTDEAVRAMVDNGGRKMDPKGLQDIVDLLNENEA